MNRISVQLYYGFPLLDNDGDPIDVLGEHAPDRYIASLYGEHEPTVPFEGNEAVFEAYWSKCFDLEGRSGIEFGSHYAYRNVEVTIVAVSEATKMASTGDNPNCLGATLSVKPEWRDKLKAFCDLSGIPFKEPEWILAVTSVLNDY